MKDENIENIEKLFEDFKKRTDEMNKKRDNCRMILQQMQYLHGNHWDPERQKLLEAAASWLSTEDDFLRLEKYHEVKE